MIALSHILGATPIFSHSPLYASQNSLLLVRRLRQSQQRPTAISHRPRSSRTAIRLKRRKICGQVDGGRNLCLFTDGIRILTSDETCSMYLHVKARHIRSNESLPLKISTRISVGKRSRSLVICGAASSSWSLSGNGNIAKVRVGTSSAYVDWPTEPAMTGVMGLWSFCHRIYAGGQLFKT